jgi:hypothetical protein
MEIVGLAFALVLGINPIHIRKDSQSPWLFLYYPRRLQSSLLQTLCTNICRLNNNNKDCCKGTCNKFGKLYETCSGEKILASSVYDLELKREKALQGLAY